MRIVPFTLLPPPDIPIIHRPKPGLVRPEHEISNIKIPSLTFAPNKK